MFRKLVVAAILFTGLLSCGKSKSGFKYSQDIVTKERSLEPDIEAAQSKIDKFADVGNYDSVVIAAAHMESLVQKKMDEIDKMPMPDAKGADAFKVAVMRYFSYIKSIYTAYKDWGNAKTEEDRQVEASKVMKIIGERDNAIEDMQQAQKKYADVNGLTVEN